MDENIIKTKPAADAGAACVENNSVSREKATDSSSIIQSTSEEVLIDGGYGWVCVVAVAFINACTWGISTSYSVFQSYYIETNTLAGVSNLNYALIGGLQFSVSFLVSPLATKVIGRFGVRTALLLGAVVQLGSLIGASFASQIWHLYLGQAVGFGAGVGFLFIGTQNIIPQWFTKRRGLASGLAATGTGIGGIVWSFAAGALLEKLGVGWAICVLAIVSGVVNITGAIVLRDRQKVLSPAYNLFDLGLLRANRYLALVAFSFLTILAEMVILTQLPTFGTSILGLGAAQASVIGAMVAVGQTLGRSILGWASDRMGRLNMAAATAFLAGLWSLAVWTNANSYGVLVFYSICVGGLAGVFWSMIGPCTVEVMGLKRLPDSLSMLFLILVAPTTVSPLIAMKLVDADGGRYLSAQLYAGFMFIGAGLFAWMLRPWKVLHNRKSIATISPSGFEDELARDARLDEDDLAIGFELLKAMVTWAKA